MSKNFNNYKSIISKIEIKEKYEKEDLLIDELLIKKHQGIEIYYAPHNEYVNKNAKIIIVGLCPGWTQTEIAYRTAILELHNNINDEKILHDCKFKARFAGSMRKNLINMLDEIKLNQILKLKTCSELFFDNNNILHTTSLIPFPVFINGNNYNGYSPNISNEVFEKIIEEYFINEINQFRNVIIIPLGKVVQDELDKIIERYKLNSLNILKGLPHPSGANGNRRVIFSQNKECLISQVMKYGECI